MTTPALAQHTSAPSTPHSSAIPVPDPTLAGPVVTQPDLDGTHGIPYTSSAVDLPSHGYTEQEFFVSGTARAYEPVGTLTTDGRWNVRVSSTAAYRTRIIVRKPIDMRTFSGTVVVEWMNATVGRDLDVGWVFGSNAMLHDHDIYVGVSAQALPINGPAQGLQAWDPARYGSLVHPGDQYSYDMFAQVAQALRHPEGVNPIAGAKIRSMVAYGDSQSAFRLVTYADALQNRDQVFDGIFLNSRFGNGAALNTDATPPAGTLIRPDVQAKVLTLETETDIIRGSNGFLLARQQNSANFRLWEVAGSSHFNAAEEAMMRIQAFRESPFANPPLQFNSCPEAMNSLDFGDVVDTAFHDLARWTEDSGYRPPSPGLLGVTSDGTAYVKNSLGLTVGGIQLPQVAVPTGVESGTGNTGIGTCTLAGEYVPFSPAQVTALYPTHQAYASRFDAATARSVAQGFLQPYDADVLNAQAAASAVPATSNVP
ncbi:MAG TPA: alpha/beta hydrolase domain-containing protein [Pseudonocardiaceae bacterium]|nr:alpha/beta hydrolase domain-containing protein [Pseudonocardiaceae bacterium]